MFRTVLHRAKLDDAVAVSSLARGDDADLAEAEMWGAPR